MPVEIQRCVPCVHVKRALCAVYTVSTMRVVCAVCTVSTVRVVCAVCTVHDVCAVCAECVVCDACIVRAVCSGRAAPTLSTVATIVCQKSVSITGVCPPPP